MAMLARDWSHWAAGYGLPRASLMLLARRGDPLAQLLIDTGRGDDIYRLIEQVRARGRMSRAVAGTGWVSADAAIVRQVLRDSRFRTGKPWDRSPFRVIRWFLDKTDPDVLNGVEPPSMLVTDPPEHTRLRSVVARAFTPRAIQGLRTRIHEITDELLDGLRGSAECDLITEYTCRIPIAVIAEMLAIPAEETGRLHAVGESISRLLGTTASSWRDFREATTAMREFELYLAAHIERLRRDDAANSILSDVIRDGTLTDVELRMLAALLLGAGFITTTHVFGKAVVALVRHRDQLAELHANPDGWPNAVEEILRYDTTIQISARVALEHLDLQGYPIRPGEMVLLLIGGANRDPAVFDHPDGFDAARPNAREHVSFGSGVHACLGAALARMELHIGLQSLFEHFPQLTLTREPTFNDSILLHGLKHLPVSLRAANANVSPPHVGGRGRYGST